MIKLELTIDEINYILASIGKNPYAECAPLVSKIHVQAQPQVPVKETEANNDFVESK